MGIRRITANIATDAPADCAVFYQTLFGMEVAMDLGWITTVHVPQASAPIQLSMASEGGSGTEVPALSIEVDDLEQIAARLSEMGIAPEYGPVTEPWGVRRLYTRDPAGTLLNILTHDSPAGGG